MKVLGIDTILHNTCAAVVEDGRFVLSNVVKSHEFRSDRLYDLTLAHLRHTGKAIEKALDKVRLRPEKIDLVAVNNFGSQLSNILIGMAAAQVLSEVYKIPLIGVPHQEAHFFSCFLERKLNDFKFPIIVFSSSGGHSAIALIKNSRFEFSKLNEIDGMEEKKKNLPYFRGLGAVYGLVANALGLARPIGSAPLLSKAAETGNPSRFNLIFRRPEKTNILDFAFIEKEAKAFLRWRKDKRRFSRQFIADFSASFENAVSEMVIRDLAEIAEKYKAKEIHLVGGISANRVFRKKLNDFAKKIGVIGRAPIKPEYSTDNAAMTASLGYYRYKQNPKKYAGKVPLVSNFRLEKMAIEQILNSLTGKNFYQL